MSDTQSTKKTKKFQGTVVSCSMNKTVVVSVPRFVKHPKYKKYYKVNKKYKAHDEQNQFKVGDTVAIAECKPISKDKTFIVVTE